MAKRIISGMLAVLSAVLMFGGTYVYANPTTSVTNNFSTGIVDIELDEWQVSDDGTEEPWEDGPTILPGAEISKIPRITNEGNSCYVRVKITFEGTDHVDEDDLYGVPDGWIRAEDGYWYYEGILDTGDTVDVFSGLSIPADLPESEQGRTFTVRVDADAIQSANFTPDFTSTSPWGAVVIENCIHEDEYDVTTFKTADSQSLLVEYRGDAKKLVSEPDDFFTNFPVLLPGDTYSDTAKLDNDGKKEIKLYFRSEALDGSDLLDKIELTIECTVNGEKKTVYEGNLRAEDVSSGILLCTLPAGAGGDFSFTIHVPEELNNQYTVLESYVKWIFWTGEEDGTVTPTSTPAGSTAQDTGTTKTGDVQKAGLWMLVAGIAAGCAAAALGKDRKERRDVKWQKR